jgi:hypothetical protein
LKPAFKGGQHLGEGLGDWGVKWGLREGSILGGGQ